VGSSGQAYKADAELVFEITSRQQVLQLLESLPGLPVVMVAAGCTSFVPEARFEDRGKGEKVTPVGEVIFRLEKWCGYLREEFYWWAELAGSLVKVTARTSEKQRPEALVRASSERLSQDSVEVSWGYENLPAGKVMRWAGGDESYPCPVSVHQTRGTHMRTALEGSQSMTAKVLARR
jgi:hypothetical protein